MANKFQPLGFTTRKGVQWLAESQVAKPRFTHELHAANDLAGFALCRWRSRLPDLCKEIGGRFQRHIENLMNVLPTKFHAQSMSLIALALTFRAGYEEIAEELHLDLLIAVPPATFTASITTVKAEESCGDAFGFSVFGFGK